MKRNDKILHYGGLN
ncbi:hypothetical protein VSP53_05125 [Escherichia coli]|uniref:Uncharacterized protein n=1 Tax=Escherichia coli TaxID=562 RepID=A0AAW7VBQ1_ECOLX|nr:MULTISPECIES: hypothetical protein [Escherichia]EHQ5527157.1 hypothetical protein [Escherichia coli O2]EJE8659207.1 hypothetical protein [Shigella sonnei]MBB2226055.1 hypothetical protein [Escherichia sp. 79.0191]MBB2251441.1 hypothetical protein [Escherichia sp. 0.2392]MBB2270994.1 hypothetical protein [Escherichia sp. 94.0001]MDG9695534.1 hypothetical protein [Streptomyces sp. DH17]HBD4496291.1 hypothetical protein [Shigella flexneri]